MSSSPPCCSAASAAYLPPLNHLPRQRSPAPLESHTSTKPPADPKDIDTRVVAYIWVNPAFAGSDSKTPAIDIERHLKADLPPAIVFFGDMDGYKKSWDNGPYAKWKALGTKTIDYLIALGENHGFWNYCTQWQTVMLIASDRFLVQHGLLAGEPTLQAPATGEKFDPAPEASTRKKVY